MRIKRIKILNILSIEEEEIDFEDSGLCLVEGWNFDDDRANGAGKTSIFNALSFALYGNVPRKITKSEILRRGSKKGSAEVDVELGNGRVIRVCRTRPNKLYFEENGRELKEMTQEEFEKLLNLTYDQFLLVMYTSQNSNDRFLDKNDASKKDFFLRLMDLEKFTKCRKKAEDKIKSIKTELQTARLTSERKQAEIDAHKKYIVDVDEIKKLIVPIINTIKENQKQIQSCKSIKAPDVAKFNDMQKKLLAKHSNNNNLIGQISTLENTFNRLGQSKNISPRQPDTHCPDCSVPVYVMGKQIVKADDPSALQNAIDLQIANITKEQDDMGAQISNLRSQIISSDDIDRLLSNLNNKKEAILKDYNWNQNQIVLLNNDIEYKKKDLKNHTERINSNSYLLQSIYKLESELITIETNIDDHIKDIELHSAISLMYSPTGAPAYIMDSLIDSFNESVDKYVSMVWPNASYRLNTSKENKTGDVTSKFSETLVMNGKQCSIGSLSGGEAKALSLAIDFTIIDILKIHFSIDVNPIILDEPFDSLDVAGREIVINLLSMISRDRQIWVIDHASETKSMFSKVLKIEKKSGISRIV